MNYSHFVGIDVSKQTLDASILDSEENELSHMKFKNSPSGQISAVHCFALKTWWTFFI